MKTSNHYLNARGGIYGIEPPGKLNLLGSNGYPLNGDPSAFHAFFNISIFSYSSDVGRPYLLRF